jgi:hypothetical protein
MFSMGANALEVYKWVDAQGVTHYSDSPPPESVDMASAETLEVLSDYEAPAESKDNYRAILAVANDLERSRLARERIRAAEQSRAQTQQFMGAPTYAGGYGYGAAFPFFSSPFAFHGPFFPHTGFFNRLQGPSHPLLLRGNFVPDVRFRPPFFSPSAIARARGGEALRQ